MLWGAMQLIPAKVPLSGGGVTYAWKSPLVIVMITIGAILALIFIIFEWKIAKVPILPRRFHPSWTTI